MRDYQKEIEISELISEYAGKVKRKDAVRFTIAENLYKININTHYVRFEFVWDMQKNTGKKIVEKFSLFTSTTLKSWDEFTSELKLMLEASTLALILEEEGHLNIYSYNIELPKENFSEGKQNASV